MKKQICFIVLLLNAIIFFSCASFSPGSLNITPAVSTPGSIVKDSISLYVKEINARQSERIFDCDILSKGYQPLSIAISNRSNFSVVFTPDSIPKYVNVDEVLSATDFHPIIRIFTWSIPWIIDMGKANRANDDRADFFNNMMIKPVTLETGQDIQGVVFLRKNYPKPLHITLLKNENQIIFDVLPSE